MNKKHPLLPCLHLCPSESVAAGNVSDKTIPVTGKSEGFPLWVYHGLGSDSQRREIYEEIVTPFTDLKSLVFPGFQLFNHTIMKAATDQWFSDCSVCVWVHVCVFT